MTYAISRAPVLRKTVRMQTVRKEDMMNNFEYTVMKMFWKAGSVLHISGKKSISKWFRRNGMKIGDNCTICCNILPSEPYLVTIGNNVTISAPVQLLTHDNSIIKSSSPIQLISGKHPSLHTLIITSPGNGIFHLKLMLSLRP